MIAPHYSISKPLQPALRFSSQTAAEMVATRVSALLALPVNSVEAVAGQDQYTLTFGDSTEKFTVKGLFTQIGTAPQVFTLESQSTKEKLQYMGFGCFSLPSVTYQVKDSDTPLSAIQNDETVLGPTASLFSKISDAVQTKKPSLGTEAGSDPEQALDHAAQALLIAIKGFFFP